MSRFVTSVADTGSASDRLQALGLALPELRENPYYVHHRSVGSSIYISGQLPYQDGWLLGQGIVGRDVELEAAQGLARQAALNAIAVAADAVGDQARTPAAHGRDQRLLVGVRPGRLGRRAQLRCGRPAGRGARVACSPFQ